MTAQEIIEKIRAEVERLKDEYTDIAIDSHYGFVNANYVVYDLEQLLSLLSDLEKECGEEPSEGKEIDIEKFIEKMDAWKARFSRPDDIPIKATMAFTARMFYMYPKVARKWYESLPKATQD